jgi:uncharacterized membrane protein YjgN (DUF898 family)
MDQIQTTEENLQVPVRDHQIQFHGKTKEYFRIWIVNFFLTVLTLGIYSAWAKVRTKKYLYGNTEVAGARFDYHGDPLRILLGRIMMGVLVAIYTVGGNFSFILGLFGLALFTVVMPWMIVRSLMFNFANTSYRNIRFGFKDDYSQSYSTHLYAGFIYIFTFGMGFPFALYQLIKFKLNGIRFGNQPLIYAGAKSLFVKVYYVTFLAFIFLAIIGGLLASKLGPQYMFVLMILIYAGFFIASGFVTASLHNINTSHTTIGSIRLKANLDPWKLTWIYVTNVVACLFTFGLAIPWATLRAMRYRLESTQVIAQDNALEQIAAMETAGKENAVADAAADFWDIELGF